MDQLDGGVLHRRGHGWRSLGWSEMNTLRKRQARASFSEATLRIAIQGALVLLTSQAALAQVRPGAGDVARDVAPIEVLPAPKGQTSLTTPQGDQAAGHGAGDTTRIWVHHIRVTGAKRYPAQALEKLVAHLDDGERSLADLTAGALLITHFYHQHGWMLAHAYLPAQSIKGGDVEIRVVEGTLSNVYVKTDPNSRLRASIIDAYLASVERDAPLNQPQVNRALLLLSDLPGASLTANLSAGAQPGQTDLTVHNATAPIISGELTADNYGSRYTGDARLGGVLNLNSPFGYGEQFTAQLLASNENLYYGRFAGQLPLGSDGLSSGLAFTHTHYLLGSNFADLDAHGHADVAQWNLAYPFIRRVSFSVIGQFTAESRDLFDEVGATSSETHKHAFFQSFNLFFSGRDDLLGGADSQAALRLGTGTLHILSQPAAAIDASGAHSAGRYDTLNIDLQRNQHLSNHWSLLLSGHAQLASRNLDSYQKFVLGGPDGVRGYPAGEGTGDQGWLASAELSYAINSMLIPGVFYDVGGVAINKHPYLDSSNSRALHDAGVGIHGSRGRFNWNVALAFRGAEHAQSEPDRAMRGWMQIGWMF
jgi:hemolysin activation/secretion protein